MSQMQISAGALDTLERGFQQARELTERELLIAMTTVTGGLEGQVKETVPVGWGGAETGLKGSITSDAWSTPAGALGVVGTVKDYADVVELGRRPGKGVSKEGQVALGAWVTAVLHVSKSSDVRSLVFAISQKIKREGLKAQRPFARTLERHENDIVREFENAASRIAQGLAGSAA